MYCSNLAAAMVCFVLQLLDVGLASDTDTLAFFCFFFDVFLDCGRIDTE